MKDERLIAQWKRQATVAQWAREHLPGPVLRAVSAVYRQRPAARTDRRGGAMRQRVAAEVHQQCGGVVQRGPFAGMIFPFATWDAPAKCIGSYEMELHPEVERIIATGYTTIINVGCAEGYYAIGLARAVPGAKVYAYDTSSEAVARCQEMAAVNALPADRIQYGGEVTHEVLNQLCRPGSLVIADIEGGEADLLDPDQAPTLANTDMLVELHHHLVPDVESTLRTRFESTHTIRHVDSQPRLDPAPYPELAGLDADDKRLAMFERPITMRWLLLTSKRSFAQSVASS